ncbi:ATP-dependent DNA helicase [Caldimonas brevitalea]|uniref:ATP-dependent DNA helicase n=1 Tax=Caldimonas brevitalea TaxID=413882 RepID=UPI00063FFBCF|nr:ATP-dependent DNA helicase [Caldimonas brevitalea]
MKYLVAVRSLCEFTAKQGDLDLRFTPSPSAQEGIAGHALVASRRPAHYQSEVSLSGDYRNLTVRGRADGYDPERRVVEEVKTYRGDLARMPMNHRALHWAQLKVYGWLLCQQLGLPEVELALVYFDIGTRDETVLTERHSADALRRSFDQQCEAFLAWAEQELAHRARRDAALAALSFPHPAFRPGQRPLAEAVYKAASGGRCLTAQAPTGIGKTVGTLFPLLKACPGQALDKVVFLTAKGSGRQLALDALDLITSAAPVPLGLRVLELVARDKACEHPDKACHGESCPLAQGFYDRLPAARAAALGVARLDRAALRESALAHRVCPYYLGQELARWADVVVGDYNYYFDTAALLHGLTLAEGWRVAVLVDEAHNLVERGRKMYSAELHQAGLRQVKRTAVPAVKRALDALGRCWNALNRAQGVAYQAYDAVPERLLAALQKSVAAIGEHFAEQPAAVDRGLQDFYFDALHFLRLAEQFGDHSLVDLTLDSHPARPGARPASVLCLRNVVPAPFLGPRFAAARSVALFSATLSPSHYYRDMLGLPADTVSIDVESPFNAEQLDVRIASHISTRWRDRDRSVAPIVELMAAQYAGAPGNYLAFFSSFDYLRQVAAALAVAHPDIPQWAQSPHMTDAAREAFLQRFTADGRGIGFAVLGGSFGEGVDLPGQRLVGAFVATLGLPQFNPVNEQMKRCVGALLGSGEQYTYLYPGLQKVVQAAGRVIRTPSDQGVVYLIDDRYARAEVRALLPGWWKPRRANAGG